MRHRIKTDRLGRFSSLRKATINSIARSLILNQSIKTTYAKAKAASGRIEQLITLAKQGTLQARRRAYRVLLEHKLVSKLFGEIADLFKSRSSGYTRILKTGKRRGDGAQLVLLEFTEKSVKEKKVKKEKPAEIEKGKPAETTEQPQAAEEKPHPAKEEKPKIPEKKKQPTKKFLGGLRSFFKKERDSL